MNVVPYLNRKDRPLIIGHFLILRMWEIAFIARALRVIEQGFRPKTLVGVRARVEGIL